MAATSAVKVGIKCVAYRNSSSYGSPTWVAAGSILGVDVQVAWETADASARASLVKLFAKTMFELGFDINARADNAAADYIAMFTAAMSQTGAIDMLILDGDMSTEGVQGFRAHLLFCGAPQDQGPGAVIYTKFPVKPAYDPAGYPKWATVGASAAMTYTTIS